MRLRQIFAFAAAQKVAQHGGWTADGDDGQLGRKTFERVRQQESLLNVALHQRVAERNERGILGKTTQMAEIKREVVAVAGLSSIKINRRSGVCHGRSLLAGEKYYQQYTIARNNIQENNDCI